MYNLNKKTTVALFVWSRRIFNSGYLLERDLFNDCVLISDLLISPI